MLNKVDDFFLYLHITELIFENIVDEDDEETQSIESYCYTEHICEHVVDHFNVLLDKLFSLNEHLFVKF